MSTLFTALLLTDVRKDGPTVGDVHVNRPMGSGKKGKRKRIQAKGTSAQEIPLRTTHAASDSLLGSVTKGFLAESDVTDLESDLKAPRLVKADSVSFDVPLFLRLLETAREEIKTDEPLHVLAERVIQLSGKSEKPLDMSDYAAIMSALKPSDLESKEVAKRISGNSDISLNAKGKALANRLGTRLHLKGGLDVLHSSTLPRAIETADAIVKANPETRRAEPTPALCPWHLGSSEGKQPDQVMDLLKHYIEHPDEQVPGKGADGKPGESFSQAVKRQLDCLSQIYSDWNDHPVFKIGVVMHSRGMELLKAWVKDGCPKDYELDTEALINPDDPEHADVLRWHGEDKIKETNLEEDDELKPGVYLILHSLTDDDTDAGNPELEKVDLDGGKEAIQDEVIKRYLPPIEVHRAAKDAWDGGTSILDVTAPLAESEGLTETGVRKVLEHFLSTEAATEPQLTAAAWGGSQAKRWAERVVKRIERERIEKAGDEHWVTLNGNRVLIGADGEIKAGSPMGAAGFKFAPTERMIRAMKAYKGGGAEAQKAADEQERIVSKALGVPRTKDNSAFDLRNDRLGIELKTMTESAHGKITMTKTALARKNDEIKSSHIKAYTVVADKRAGGTTYYVKAGVGSFRVNSMTQATLSEIKAMVHK